MRLATAKLTALWALSEGGLGGILHVTRLPFRGILLACFAAISICLIHRVSGRRTAALKSALLVVAIKAVLAPHSPVAAYVAVLLQAGLGTACLLLLGRSLMGCLAVGVVCLIETSLHPLVWGTALGGMEFWNGLDGLGRQAQEALIGRVVVVQAARFLVAIYLILHAGVGLAAGAVAWWLPRAARGMVSSPSGATRASEILTGGDARTCPLQSFRTTTAPKRRGRTIAGWLAIGLGITVVTVAGLEPASSGPWHGRVLFASVRVVGVVGVFVFIVGPAVGYVIERLRRRARGDSEFARTLGLVHALREDAMTVWLRASDRPVWRRLPYCFGVMVARALNPPTA